MIQPRKHIALSREEFGAERYVVVRGRLCRRAGRAPRSARAADARRAPFPRGRARCGGDSAYPDPGLFLPLFLALAAPDSDRRAGDSGRGGGRAAPAASAQAEAAGGETEAPAAAGPRKTRL